MSIKKFCSVLLCVCMMLSLLPTAALAIVPFTGVIICDGTNKISLGKPTPSDDGGEYFWKNGEATANGSETDYNVWLEQIGTTGNSYILHLKDAYIKNTGTEYDTSLYITGTDDVIVRLEGASCIVGPDGTDSFGIDSDVGLTFTGDGALTVTGGNGTNDLSCGIGGQNITVGTGTDSPVINAQGGPASNYSYGIFANNYNNTVTLKSGALNAYGGAAKISAGIHSVNFAVTGGTANVQGGAASDSSYGVFAGVSVTIGGGTVNAQGGAAGSESYGIDGGDGFELTGGTVNAWGGDISGTAAASYGVSVMGSDSWIAASSGTLNAQGGAVEGTGDTESFGLRSYGGGGGIYVTGGVINAQGGTSNSTAPANASSAGISVQGSVKLTGGVTIARAGLVNGEFNGANVNRKAIDANVTLTGIAVSAVGYADAGATTISSIDTSSHTDGTALTGTISNSGSFAPTGAVFVPSGFSIKTPVSGITLDLTGDTCYVASNSEYAVQIDCTDGNGNHLNTGDHSLVAVNLSEFTTASASGIQTLNWDGTFSTGANGRIVAVGGMTNTQTNNYIISSGINAACGLDFSNSAGSVIAFSGSALGSGEWISSWGIFSGGLTTGAGLVTAFGGATAGDSCGIYGSLITGTGDVNAFGGNALNGGSFGINTNYRLTLAGGTTVNVFGGAATGNSCGVGIFNPNDSIVGVGGDTAPAVLNAFGGTAGGSSYGLSGTDTSTLTVNKNSTFNALAGEAGGSGKSIGVKVQALQVAQGARVNGKGETTAFECQTYEAITPAILAVLPASAGVSTTDETPKPLRYGTSGAYTGDVVSFGTVYAKAPTVYTVSGMIIGSDTNAGIAATVRLIDAETKQEVVNSPVYSAADGTYSFANVSAGTYLIGAQCAGYADGEISSFAVTNAAVTGKTLTLNKIYKLCVKEVMPDLILFNRREKNVQLPVTKYLHFAVVWLRNGCSLGWIPCNDMSPHRVVHRQMEHAVNAADGGVGQLVAPFGVLVDASLV